MNRHRTPGPGQKPLLGLACGTTAFLIWGLSPLYWKTLQVVPSFEILMHRTVWSFIFLAVVLLLQGQWHAFAATFRDLRMAAVLLGSSVIAGSNWFVYIWAINHDRVLQASLGYFINPLVNVFLGMVFLRERLRPLQALAVALAGIAVLDLVVRHGQFPWVALYLAFSFGLYGLIRKVAPVTALVGLSMETLILSVPALAYLLYLDASGTGSFFRVGGTLDLLLMGTALVTALPLLLFILGAKRLHLSTVGFLQYISPSSTFFLALFVFHEPLPAGQWWSFGLIWTALTLYSADSFVFYKRAAHFPKG